VWGEPRDHDEVIRVLRRAVELGVTFIDTADSYGPEVNERVIREALHPYAEDLVIATKAGLTRPGPGSGYFHSERIGRSKHFGVWPLAEAAQACFGSAEWPAGRPVPQVSIEFEVESVDAVADAAAELRGRGFELLHDAREEPWGQTVARLLSSEGSIIGISYAPRCIRSSPGPGLEPLRFTACTPVPRKRVWPRTRVTRRRANGS